MRKGKKKGTGTIKSPGSTASRAFKGLGNMRAGMLHDTVPVLLGAAPTVATTLGIRFGVKPIGDDGKPNWMYTWAPALGFGVGALGAVGSFFLAGGRKGSGWGAAAASGLSALISAGSIWAYDMMLGDKTDAERAQHFQALLGSGTSPTAAPTTAPQQGFRGEIVATDVRGLPAGHTGLITATELAGQNPGIHVVQGVIPGAYGVAY